MSQTSVIDREIGWRLRIQRIATGLDRKTFARLIGASERDIVSFEAGQERIDARSMYLISKILNVQVSYFFESWLNTTIAETAAIFAAA